MSEASEANVQQIGVPAPVTIQLSERDQAVRRIGQLDVQIEATEMRLQGLRQERDGIVRKLAEPQEDAKPETPAE